MARGFGFGNRGGILGMQDQQPSWAPTIGILGAALADAGAALDGRQGGNMAQYGAQLHDQQAQQQLMEGLNSQDPAIRQRAYSFAALNGIDTKPFQQQRVAQELPTLLQGLKPAQPGAAAPSFNDLLTNASPEVQSVYGPKLIEQQIDRAAKAKRTLTPQEAVAAGFRPGSVVQIDPNNDYSIAQASDVASNDKLAQELWLKNNDPMLAVSRANLGISRERLDIDRQKAARGEVPSGYRPAAGGNSLEFIPGGPADPTKGAGKKAPTEDQAKNTQLYQRASQQLPIALAHFDELAKPLNQIGAGLPLIGGAATTSTGYQQGNNALTDIAASYLYSVSGATANPGEVKNLAQTITPKFGEGRASIEEKKARLQQMVESIKARAQPTSATLAAPAMTGSHPPDINALLKKYGQ